MTTIFDILKTDQEIQSKKIKKYFKILFLLFIVYLVCFLGFIVNINQKENIPNDKTDAIVVLTGASGRITEGIKQLIAGKSDKLFISGVYKKNSNGNVIKKTILQLSKKTNPIPSNILSKIEEGKAKSTIENALETKVYTEGNNIKSIRLITSYYHIPRVKILFSKYLPNTKITYHPIYTKKEKNIFKHNNFLIVFLEYNKFLITILLDKLNLDTKTILRLQGAL